MMKPFCGPAPLVPLNRRSWFGARLRVAGTHCRLVEITIRWLSAFAQTRSFPGIPPTKGFWAKPRPIKSV